MKDQDENPKYEAYKEQERQVIIEGNLLQGK